MGLESRCDVRYMGELHTGEAHLDSQVLTFRGGTRIAIPLADLQSVEAKRGLLEVAWPLGRAVFELGADAETWALKLRYPRSRLDKLGVKPGARVAVLGLDDPGFEAELAARTEDVARARPRPQTDVVIVRMDARKPLPRLATLRRAIKQAGCIWVVWPKGQKALREGDVRAAALEIGLVDVKVVSFSETLSGLKLVIRKSGREKNSA